MIPKRGSRFSDQIMLNLMSLHDRPRRSGVRFGGSCIRAARGGPSTLDQSGRFTKRPITPTIPSRNKSTQTTKTMPCTTVTQAPRVAR